MSLPGDRDRQCGWAIVLLGGVLMFLGATSAGAAFVVIGCVYART